MGLEHGGLVGERGGEARGEESGEERGEERRAERGGEREWAASPGLEPLHRCPSLLLQAHRPLLTD